MSARPIRATFGLAIAATIYALLTMMGSLSFAGHGKSRNQSKFGPGLTTAAA
jgi:hypothetical protein